MTKTKLILLFLLPSYLFSQNLSNHELSKQILQLDSLLFEEGFNKCELNLLDGLIHNDFEFYHDQNGIQNKTQFLKAFTESICSSPERKPIRKLLPETVEIYPLFNEGILYGAIENGFHEFYIKEIDQPLYITNIAQFTSLWIIENDAWKLKRVLSFDHQVPEAKYSDKFESKFHPALFSNDSLIVQLINKHKIPSVSIAYINEGEVQGVHHYGESQKNISVGNKTFYKVASLTKPIVAITVLKLVEQGKWDLDEPLVHYYNEPELKDHAYLEKLTTRNVLSHQSGLPNWRYNTPGQKLSFDFEPGTKFQYSGEGFEYLRKSLEVKFKTDLETLAKKQVFEPANMEHSSFTWTSNLRSEDYAIEHDEKGLPLEYEKHTQINAAANFLTTSEDYAKFLAYIHHQAGLSDSLYLDFIHPHSTVKNGLHWGLGMQIIPELNKKGHFAIQHTGGDFGLKAIAILIPHTGKGIVILSNSENGIVLWKKIISEYLSDEGQVIVDRNIQE